MAPHRQVLRQVLRQVAFVGCASDEHPERAFANERTRLGNLCSTANIRIEIAYCPTKARVLKPRGRQTTAWSECVRHPFSIASAATLQVWASLSAE